MKKFGEIPSANAFANEFNIRAYGTKTITGETARKWMHGLAVPEIDKLLVLVDWLEINVLELFPNSAKDSDSIKHHHIEFHINNCIEDLSEGSKNAVLLTAWLMRQLEAHDYDFGSFQSLLKEQLAACSSCQYRINKQSNVVPPALPKN